jgi:hypothetical protein
MSLKKILTYSILWLTAISGFFGNVDIDTNTENNSVISFSVNTNSIYAATGDVTSAGAAKMYNEAIDILNLLLWVITVIVSPAIMFAGWLMSPDWTSGDLFGLRAPMYSLWVTVSNIVYFIYAVLLIMIALGTMFGQDKFSYKVMLPKLALGIIMVPFTWWFVQWTISIASVVTAAVITIPNETMNQDTNKESKLWTTPSIPELITINETSSWSEDKTPKCPTGCISPEKFLTNSAGMYSYMMVYAYSIFKFQDVKKLDTVTDILKAWVWIVHQGIIAAIMFIVFWLLTLALVAMLLVRAIKLWVYAIFSPLFTFRFVAGSNLLGWDKDDSFTIKEFIGLAFVPAIVWLTLSFGLIMVNAVSSAKPANGWTQVEECTPIKIKAEPWCTLMTIMWNSKNTISRVIRNAEKPNEATTVTTVAFGWIKMEFVWKAGAAKEKEDSAASNTATWVLNAAGWVFGTIIIDIIALIFIWMAFMAAKWVSKAVEWAISPFEDIGKKIGGLAKDIPKYTPIPGLNISASGISKVIEKKEQWMISDRQNRDANSTLGRWAWLDAAMSPATQDAIKKLADKNTANVSDIRLARTQLSTESDGNKQKGTIEAMNNLTNALGENIGKENFKLKDEKEFRLKLKDGWNITDPAIIDKLIKEIKDKKGSLDSNYFKNDLTGKDIFKGIYGSWSSATWATVASPKNQTPPANGGPATPPSPPATPPNP